MKKIKSIFFVVDGKPVPQGSHKGFYVRSKKTGRNHVVITDNQGRKLKTWRENVSIACLQAMRRDNFGIAARNVGVRTLAEFFLPRPKCHYVGNNPSNRLRLTAPKMHVVKPDCDKLKRAIHDALTGLLYEDDSQVIDSSEVKKWADYDCVPRCFVTVEFFCEDEKE